MIKELRRNTFLLMILYFSKIQTHILENLQNNGAGFLSSTTLVEIMASHIY